MHTVKSSVEPKVLRQRVLEIRNRLSLDEGRRRSSTVMDRFRALESDWGRKSLCVGLYSALPGEVDLQELEAEFQAKNYRICYPRVSDLAKKKMEFVEIPSSSSLLANLESRDDAFWQKGSYGIREPRSEFPAILPEELDLILVPGVVFGLQGERIGRGSGYYDRYLQQVPEVLRVSLVFDFQVLPELTADLQASWDQPVHWVISESRDFKSNFTEIWKSRRK